MHAPDRIPFTAADVTPHHDGSWEVSWSAPGTGRVEVQTGPSSDGPWRSAGDGEGSATLTVGGADPERRFARLQPDQGAALVIGPRHLGLESSPNLRDAGGYRTSTGQWVRMGAVYRSGVLTLSDADFATVTALGLRHSYDLRTPGENETEPDRLPAGATRYSLNVSGGAKVEVPPLESVDAVVDLMSRAPIAYLSMPSAVQAFGGFLAGLAANDGPSVFHCTAGKDRTGWAGVLLLTLLDVPEEVVMADYLLSNDYFLGSPRMQAHMATLSEEQAAVHEAMIGVRPAYISVGLEAVREQFGSMTGYATAGLGLDPSVIDRLREKLLVGAPHPG